MKASRRRDDRAFTLIETLVVLLILGVVGAVFASSMVGAMKADRKTRARADVQAALILAAQHVTKEVRVAAPLVSMSATAVTADVYRAFGGPRYRHTFTIAGGQLTEVVQVFNPATSAAPSATTTRVLTTSLQAASAFTARDRAGVVTTTATKVASIDIDLVGLAAESPTPVTTSTTVFLRNYKES